jgi:Beta-glucosidase-related glycosidases
MQTIPNVNDLTLEEKIGQMLCFGWGGPDSLENVNAQAIACVRDLKAGSMIVMGRNVQAQTDPMPPVNIPAVRAMTEELNGLAAIPLLLPTDQEGGRVARFGTPFTPMPAAGVVGRAGDTDLARAAARITGAELRQAGVNWNFAPVADINSNPLNPVIGERAFADTPEATARMVAAQVEGYREGGVLACVKHFPGHGDTHLDSHLALPSLPFDLDAMEARELVPFRAAIAAGVPSVMTAHIVFPAVDPEVPATLSPPILTGILRERLGFTGLIVTDCLEMKAVSTKWGTPRAAVMAAKAGADVLLVCHTAERQRAAHAALLEAARSGELPAARIDEAVSRVLAAKRLAWSLPETTETVPGAPESLAVVRAICAKAGVPFAEPTGPTTLGAEAPV